jgi:hypothetical protein
MRMPRITIGLSMGLVALMAIGIAAFRRPSWLASNVVFSLALAIHFAAIVALLTVQGPARGFWKGFVACGWGYLILSLGPGLESSTGPYLATTALLDVAYQDWLASPSGIPIFTKGLPDNSPVISKWKLWDWPDSIVNTRVSNSSFYIMTPDAFLRIGHSAFSLLTALLGGTLGRMLSRRSAAALVS